MNPATDLARAVLGELVAHGVREVVLSPGSRSAPLAFAAARLEQAGAIRLHVRVDERSAGYLALGLAKVSGQPVVVACTSGTAVANLSPAVVEASYSAIPLVVLTADRPIEARGVGSPQTIDQVGIFGGMVRFCADLGSADPADPEGAADSADARGARRIARAAVAAGVAAARGTRARPEPSGDRPDHPGPVHLNVGFRLPLVPDPADLAAPMPAEESRQAPPVPAAAPRIGTAAVAPMPARGMLVVGDLPPAGSADVRRRLVELASAHGWPILAEPSANLHEAPTALDHGVLVAGDPAFLAAHRPEIVLSAGLFGLSRPTLDVLRAAQRHVALDLPGIGREVCDPARTASTVLRGVPDPGAGGPRDRSWLASWQRADATVAAAVAEHLAAAELTGSAVAATVWAAAPSDALLLVAASWPVRHVEAFGGRRTGPLVVGNRGANGIDGLVSTAWGAALAHQGAGGGPALALMGDLALLHDHNGLLAGAGEPQPDLVIVVSDNDGGGIFHQLEQGRPEYADVFERLFGTPLGRDLVAVAAAAGVPARRVSTGDQLDEALAEALGRGGVRVVVADVRDRADEGRQLERLRERVGTLLAWPGPGNW